jgi:hypothetical protein
MVWRRRRSSLGLVRTRELVGAPYVVVSSGGAGLMLRPYTHDRYTRVQLKLDEVIVA